MERGASLTFPDGACEARCRPMLYRHWRDDGLIFAWLMANPSRASHLIDDPTAGRVVTFTDDHGGGTAFIGNFWTWRTPYPADLWSALQQQAISEAMATENIRVLEILGASADRLVVAFGAEPMRRHPEYCRSMLAAFTRYNDSSLLCLGTTDDGMPLHPLARGKHAIRKGTKLRPWVPV